MPAEAPQSVTGRASLTLVFLRVLVCGFAFALAVLAASAVGTFGLFRGLEEDSGYTIAFLSTFGLGTLIIASAAILPFAAVIIISESFSWRSVILFPAAGLTIGLYRVTEYMGGEPTFTDPRVAVAAAAGAVGGAVYWLIAGRKAGDFRERRYVVPADESGSSGA
ncbi:MAG: hypothetical protein KI785_12255 [Devosiaceae bacterium]|nr:hypothetical protein [Devosiaceae bacterium MH13]